MKTTKVLLSVDSHRRMFDTKSYRLGLVKEVSFGTVPAVLLEHFLPDSLKISSDDEFVPIEITIKDLRQ